MGRLKLNNIDIDKKAYFIFRPHRKYPQMQAHMTLHDRTGTVESVYIYSDIAF